MHVAQAFACHPETPQGRLSVAGDAKANSARLDTTQGVSEKSCVSDYLGCEKGTEVEQTKDFLPREMGLCTV